MANIPSAEKRNRQRLKRRMANLRHLTAMRTHVKRVRAALEEKNAAAAREALSGALRIIDTAAQRGVIPRKTAARSKSRLTLAVNAME